MTPPNGDELEAFQRLAARPEGRVVLEYLQRAMSDTNKRLTHEPDAVQLRVLQGKSRVLDVLLQAWKP